MALTRRTGQRVTSSIWAGFVDAMTGLLLVLMFVLSMFMIVQFILSGTISTQSSELFKFQQRINELNENLLEKDSELETLMKRVNALIGELSAVQEQNAALIARLSAATQADAEKAARIADLESSLAAASTDQSQLAQLLFNFEQQITAFREQVAALESELQSAIFARNEYNSQLLVAEREGEEQQEQIKTLTQSLQTAADEQAHQAMLLARFEQRVADFEALVDRLRYELNNKAGLADELERRVLAAETSLRAANARIISLTSDLEQTGERNNMQSASILSLEDQIAAVRKELAAKSAQADDLEERARTIEASLRAADARIISLTSELEQAGERDNMRSSTILSLEDQIAAIRKELAAKSAQADDLEERARTIESSLRAADARIISLTADLEQAGERDNMRSSTILSLEDQIAAIRKELAAKSAQADDLEEHARTIESSLRAADARIISLTSDLEQAGERDNTQSSTILSLEDQIAAVRKELAAKSVQADDLEEHARTIESSLRAANARIISLTADLEQAGERDNTQSSTILSLEDQIAAVRKELAAKSVQADDLEERARTIESSLRDADTRIVSLISDLERAGKRNETQSESILSLEQQISEMNSRLADLRNRLQASLNEGGQVSVLLKAAEERVQGLSSKNNRLQQWLDAEKKAYEEQQIINLNLEEQRTRLEARINELDYLLKSAEAALKEQKSEFEGAQLAIQRLASQKEDLSGALVELQNDNASLQKRLDASLLRIEEVLQKLTGSEEALVAATDRANTVEVLYSRALADIESLQIALGAAEQETESLRLEVDNFQVEKVFLQQRLTELMQFDQEAADLSVRVTELQNERNQLLVSADEAQEGLIALSLDLEEARREAEETLKLLAAAEQAKRLLEQSQSERNSELSRLALQLEEKRLQLSGSEFETKRLQETTKSLRQHLEFSRQQTERMFALLQTEKAERASLEDRLEAIREESEKARASLADRQAAGNEVAELTELLFSAQRRKQEVEEINVSLQNQATQFSQQVLQLTQQLADVEQQRSELETQLQRLGNFKDRSDRELQQSELRRAEVQKLLEDANQRTSGDAERITLLNLQIAELRKELGILQSVLDDAKQKDTDAQVEIKSLGSQLNSALAQVAAEQVLRLQAEQEKSELLEREKQNLERFRSEFFGQLRRVLEGKRGVEVTGDRFVFSSEVLFASGEAELSDEGAAQIGVVAELILQLAEEFPKDIDWILRVDGHTDDRPVLPGRQFNDNWDLSQARSLAVVRYLTDEFDFPPDRLAAAGFGEFRPLVANLTADARSRNRRIEFKLTEP